MHGTGFASILVGSINHNVVQAAPNLLMTALQLVSTNLATPIFISLDPANLANDTGTMSIFGTLAGGTFNSSLNVFFDVCTAPGVLGVGCTGVIRSRRGIIH